MVDEFDKAMSQSIEIEFEKSQKEIHLRIQQRNRKKSITFVEGLDKLYDNDINFLENTAKYFRKNFNCSAIIKKPENVIQLQGDQRILIKKFLIDNKLADESQIKTHGF